MLKTKVRIFDTVDIREGENDRGPWTMIGQQAQLDGGDKSPSLPFEIRLSKASDAYPAGLYEGILVPRPGKFRNSLDWVFKDFVKAS